VKNRRQLIAPSPARHLIPDAADGDQPPFEIFLRPNGTPVLVTSEPAAWAFDRDLGDFQQIASPWWSASPLNENEGRTRNGGRSGPSGPLAEIEAKVAAMRRDPPPDPKPEWWNETMACGHYDTRLRGARLLGSKDEYRHWLKEYAKYLADESFRERAEDLLAELMGPVFQYVLWWVVLTPASRAARSTGRRA
jgi:protein HIRA/HIR1